VLRTSTNYKGDMALERKVKIQMIWEHSLEMAIKRNYSRPEVAIRSSIAYVDTFEKLIDQLLPEEVEERKVPIKRRTARARVIPQ